MRDALETLNDELEALFGVRLEVRIGVNTGEVVVGDPASGSTFVTGDAGQPRQAPRAGGAAGRDPDRQGDVPARRERRAGRAARVVPREGQERGGVAVAARAASTRRAAGVARRLDAPLVGRERELGRLAAAFAVAVGRAALPARDAARPGGDRQDAPRAGAPRDARQPGARRCTGRCLPYGDGITFWPLVELAARRSGTTPRASRRAFAEVEDRDRSLERLAGVDRRARAARAARSCSGPRGGSSRRSPPSARSCSSSRTSTGPSRRCSTSLEYLARPDRGRADPAPLPRRGRSCSTGRPGWSRPASTARGRRRSELEPLLGRASRRAVC